MARPSLEEPEERTPLLAEGNPPENSRTLYRRAVVVLCFLVLFILLTGAFVISPSLIAMIENRICREVHPELEQHFRSGGSDDLCKTPEVQGKLAMLMGWAAMFDCMPPVLTAIPYGLLADKWGRKRVLVLSLFGFALSFAYQLAVLYFDQIFPVNTILVSSVFLLIGGSTAVAAAMLYTLVADVVPVASRAVVFFQMSAITFLAEIIGTPLAGLILLRSNWAALLVGMALFIVAIFTASLIPETLELVKIAKTSAATNAGEEGGRVQDDLEDPTRQPESDGTRNGLGEAWDFLRGNKSVAALIISLVFIVLSGFVQEMLLQYTTKRYHWSWSQATFLLTIRSIVTLLVLCIILPAASQLLLVKMKWSALKKDLWLARISGVTGILGALLIAAAFKPSILCIGLVVFAMSGGMPSLVRSLCNSLVKPEHTGILNTLISLAETMGIIVAAPALAQSLKLGMNLGGAWIGLPFICAAAIMTVSTSILWLFRVPPTRVEG